MGEFSSLGMATSLSHQKLLSSLCGKYTRKGETLQILAAIPPIKNNAFSVQQVKVYMKFC